MRSRELRRELPEGQGSIMNTHISNFAIGNGKTSKARGESLSPFLVKFEWSLIIMSAYYDVIMIKKQ